MKRLLVLSLISLSLFTGCASLNPFSGISNPPKEPRKLASYIQEETIKPVYIGKDQLGKDVVASEVHRTYSASSEETKPKASLWSKIIAFGWGWIILMVLGLFFPPIAAIMGLFNRTLGHGVTKIVVGVQKGLDKIEEDKSYSGKEVKEMLLTEMSKVSDDKTKKLVKQIKTKEIK